MKINIEPHTLVRMKDYHVSVSEIEEVLIAGMEVFAKKGRKAKFKIFPFNRIIQGKFYPQVRLEVIYVEEGGEIFTVTIYAKYGDWEK